MLGSVAKVTARKVLVVDDEEDIAAVLQDRLESYGFEVATAGTGLEALRKVSEEKFQGIFMDVKLPELDGMSALQEIRKRDREIPIIILTAFSNRELAVEAVARGANDYVLKPFDMAELKMKVQKAYHITLGPP